MTQELLYRLLDEILQSAPRKTIILTGIYLEPEAASLLRLRLTPNTMNPKSIGRFEGVPVFNVDQKDPEKETLAERNGIYYSYVKMDFVN